MFRAFNVSIQGVMKEFYDVGKYMYEKDKRKIKDTLESLILPSGALDGSKMQEQWFPMINAEIFISHSHRDEADAISLAGWLSHHLDTSCFIDSAIWGNSDELLKLIDNKYCLNANGETYDYKMRNSSTSHVHMMLSTALMMMIDRTECLFFLNTPNSIQPGELVKTRSAWIYSEISISRLIRRKNVASHRAEITKTFSKSRQLNEGVTADYLLPIAHLTKLNSDGIKEWLKYWRQGSLHDKLPLDTLYNLNPE